MNCPKCKSPNVEDGTAGTQRCLDCDFAFVPYNTAPRFLGTGQPKASESPVAVIVLVLLSILIAVAVGFVSLFMAVVIAVVGLLAAILVYLVKLSGRSK